MQEQAEVQNNQLKKKFFSHTQVSLSREPVVMEVDHRGALLQVADSRSNVRADAHADANADALTSTSPFTINDTATYVYKGMGDCMAAGAMKKSNTCYISASSGVTGQAKYNVCEDHCSKLCGCLGFQVSSSGNCDVIMKDEETRYTVLNPNTRP